ncbi:ABC transporter permease [Lysinibacillus sp. NPDC094403]|uniref:ABC transporter permease n=1 Tax=Lysinibacillus sp. NPDC094403 TaxID=3390581 RepID=UPI003CFE43B6
MISRLILSNNIKARRSWSWRIVLFFATLPLVLLLIFAFLSNGQVNTNPDIEYTDLWKRFVFSVHWILIFSLPLGITIQASITANIEHQGNSWKQTLSLPLKKSDVYISKFITLLMYNMFSAVILTLGIITIGVVFGIGRNIEWYTVLAGGFYPYIAALPIMAIQLWLSISITNQAFPIIFGTVFGMAGLFFSMNKFTKWLPWAYPVNATPVTVISDTNNMILNHDIHYIVIIAIIEGVLLLFLGLVNFLKREVY